jgi:prepilin signal peptidase PulO-like enzyme (type II secretory pathway)
MSGWWVPPLVGILYGCSAFLGIQLSASICRNVTPFEDGPKPGKPPTPWLIGGAAAIGFTLALRGMPLPQVGLAGVLTVSLVASWYSDVRVGIVSDYFTLVPLGALALGSLIKGDYGILIAAGAVTIPFAAAALFSRGRGMGWGDVKLVALGGAVLGIHAAVLAFAAACLIAVAVAALLKRRSEPIPFAPYLAGAIAVALTFDVF